MVDFARLLRDGPPPAPRLPRLILGVTGHRPHKLDSRPGAGDGYDRDNPLRVRIRARIREETDRLRAEARQPRGRFSALHVEAAFQRTEWRLDGWRDLDVLGVTPGQERRWPAQSRETYAKVLAAAAGVLVVTPDPPPDTEAAVAALHARNDRLCAVADELIAVWDGSRGGTASCVRNWRYVGNELRAHIDPDREREALEVSDGTR